MNIYKKNYVARASVHTKFASFMILWNNISINNNNETDRRHKQPWKDDINTQT